MTTSHLPTQDDSDELYVVVESFSTEMEGFLSVRAGQVVEVLDQGGSNWLVLTLPSPGELEAEGFLPARCLRPASKGESPILPPSLPPSLLTPHSSLLTVPFPLPLGMSRPTSEKSSEPSSVVLTQTEGSHDQPSGSHDLPRGSHDQTRDLSRGSHDLFRRPHETARSSETSG